MRDEGPPGADSARDARDSRAHVTSLPDAPLPFVAAVPSLIPEMAGRVPPSRPPARATRVSRARGPAAEGLPYTPNVKLLDNPRAETWQGSRGARPSLLVRGLVRRAVDGISGLFRPLPTRTLGELMHFAAPHRER